MGAEGRGKTIPSWCKSLLIDKGYFLGVTLCVFGGFVTFAGFACLRLCGAFLEVVVVLRLLNLGLIVKRRLVGTKSCYFCWVDYLLAGLLRISLSERRISFVECLGGALGVYFDDADVFSWSRSFYKVVGEVVDLARWIHLPTPGFVYLTQGWYLFFVFIGLGHTPRNPKLPHSLPPCCFASYAC